MSALPTTSLLTQVLIADKYGPRLGTDQLATVLGITRGAVLNQISDGKFGIPTYVDGGKPAGKVDGGQRRDAADAQRLGGGVAGPSRHGPARRRTGVRCVRPACRC